MNRISTDEKIRIINEFTILSNKKLGDDFLRKACDKLSTKKEVVMFCMIIDDLLHQKHKNTVSINMPKWYQIFPDSNNDEIVALGQKIFSEVLPVCFFETLSQK